MPGTLLDGRYLLGERIGAGGMGEVWRAVDQRLNRAVAVKTLGGYLPDAGDDKRARRFRREAQTVARLSSPHIVTVHDFGESLEAGRVVPYLVMEVLRGRPLKRLLDPRPLSLDDTVRWARQICVALEVAHANAVVHCDLKPANVMVCDGDLVKVLDFGIARMLGSDGDSVTLTADGSLLGTPAYMSPEQAQGESVDGRSDLYSLGCMLYAMVTGRPPFPHGPWHTVLRSHISQRPQPPSRNREGLPAAWDDLVMELLQKRPEARPQTAAEVGQRLAALAEPADAVPRLTDTIPVPRSEPEPEPDPRPEPESEPDPRPEPEPDAPDVADPATPNPTTPADDAPADDAPENDPANPADPRAPATDGEIFSGLIIGVVTMVATAVALAPLGAGWAALGTLAAPFAVAFVSWLLTLIDDDDSAALTGLGAALFVAPVALLVGGATLVAERQDMAWWTGALVTVSVGALTLVGLVVLFGIVWGLLEPRFPRVVRIGVPASALLLAVLTFCVTWAHRDASWGVAVVVAIGVHAGVSALLALLCWRLHPAPATPEPR